MRGVGETLVLTGLVPERVIAEAMSKYGETQKFEDYLVQSNYVTYLQLAQTYALLRSLPVIDLANFTIEPAVLSLVPAAMARRHNVIPISQSGNRIALAMVDPDDLLAIDDVSSYTDALVEPWVAARDAMSTALDRYFRSDDELSNLSAALEEAASERSADEIAFTSTNESDVPIVKFVNLLISQAIQDRASDIHIEPGETELLVRYRIDGVLHDMQRADAAIQDGIVSRLKIMSDIDIAEKRIPQDGRLSVTYDRRTIDLRVATLPTVWGEKIVMRILDNTAEQVGIQNLLLSPTNLARFTSAVSRPHGMILVTGPTGSGKSTTLYTAVREIANRTVNVITVEDPVEYRLAGINQVQVNPRAGLTFNTALRSILRADPDVVLVGEIRDRETAQITVEAALTGHLVLSTLHTNDAPSALTRLADIGVEPYLVGSALQCIVAQRLARRLCDRCRESYVASDATLVTMDASPDGPPVELFRAVGCTVCSNTGYRGRIAIHEVMSISEVIEQAIVHRASASELRGIALAEGMIPMREDGWSKVREGLTTVEEVLRVVV